MTRLPWWTSLVAQTVKYLPTMWETWVQSLEREDLEKEMATHSSIFAWKIPWMEEPIVHGVAKRWTQLSDFTHSLFTRQTATETTENAGWFFFLIWLHWVFAEAQGFFLRLEGLVAPSHVGSQFPNQ